MNAQERGIWAEEVAMNYYLEQGYKLKGHRVKTLFAEIDLVFEKSNKVTLVEVKTLGPRGFLHQRIKKLK